MSTSPGPEPATPSRPKRSGQSGQSGQSGAASTASGRCAPRISRPRGLELPRRLRASAGARGNVPSSSPMRPSRRTCSPSELLAELPLAPAEYAVQLVSGMTERLDDVDELISGHSSGWAHRAHAGRRPLHPPHRHLRAHQRARRARRRRHRRGRRVGEGVLDGGLAKIRQRRAGGDRRHRPAGGTAQPAGTPEAAGSPPSDRAPTSSAGVDYDTLDAAKRLAIELAAGTSPCRVRRDASVVGCFHRRAGHAARSSAGSRSPSCSNASGRSR